MDNLELMKQEISNLAKEKKEEFEKVSDYIFNGKLFVMFFCPVGKNWH